jgi:hypothetical protein
MWQFQGLKDDYVRIARENLGIVRHIGKRLSTGFQRDFAEDLNNAAIFISHRVTKLLSTAMPLLSAT